MKVGIVTYNRTPYRKLQLEKFSEIKNIEIKVYYCREVDRDWKIKKSNILKEINLKKVLDYGEFRLNRGLFKIIRENDYIILGGYDQITYIMLSILCRILKKKYSILFDGISTNKIDIDRNSRKYRVKKLVIKHAQSIFGNGTVSKLYFKNSFDVNEKNIYNQYLTVDGEMIIKKNIKADIYREMYRKKYGISDEKKVILYSGRIVDIKNISVVVEAISLMENRKDIVLVIVGDGEEREKIIKLCQKKEVEIIITGFISEQEKVFEHYYIADIFTLMSTIEPWGLVINEAMYAKLPVIISNRAGASMDLVKEGINGFLVDPFNKNEISKKYQEILKCDLKEMGDKSLEIVKKWSFENSKKEFEKLLKKADINIIGYK